MDVIKKNFTMCFACETNRIDLLVCVVMEPWISIFWFSTPYCNHCMKCSNIMCWIYFAYIAFKTYRSLKSFQTATSFQPESSFYLVYFLAFFYASYQKSRNLYDRNELSVNKWKLIFYHLNKKIIFWF